MMPDGILNIDGFNWSLIKYTDGQLATLGAEKRAARSVAEEDTFCRYHARIREWVEASGGQIWSTIGDCTITYNFDTIDEAVAAATTIQRRLTDLMHLRISSERLSWSESALLVVIFQRYQRVNEVKHPSRN